LKKGLTQQGLATRAGLSRATVNQIERGTLREIGVARLSQLLGVLDLELNVARREPKGRPGFLQSVCISASTSFRHRLTVSELRRALLTGRTPARKEPHFRVILEEVPPGLLAGAIEEASNGGDVRRIHQNLSAIAHRLKAAEGAAT
jgi:transcriptional regulator with XRE-family HTH domain